MLEHLAASHIVIHANFPLFSILQIQVMTSSFAQILDLDIELNNYKHFDIPEVKLLQN